MKYTFAIFYVAEVFLVGVCYFSTIAQLVERMTVNHDVTGSSPVGGVWIDRNSIHTCRTVISRKMCR